MFARHTVMAALAAATFALAAPGVLTADAKADAEKHFKVGVSLLEAEDWPAAAAEFETSVQLFPTKMGLFNLANAYRAIHRYQEALDTVDRIDREFAQKLDPEFKDAMAELRREIRGMVGHLRVRVEEAGAEVVVDGRVVGKSPLDPFVLAPGEHQVEVSLSGYVAQRRAVRITVGETAKEKFDLEREKAAAAVVPVPVPVPAPTPAPEPAPVLPTAGGPVEKPVQPVAPAIAPQPKPPGAGAAAADTPKTCIKDGDCLSGFVCFGSVCKRDELAVGAAVAKVPKSCTKDKDCLGNLVCTGGVCRTEQPVAVAAPKAPPPKPPIVVPPPITASSPVEADGAAAVEPKRGHPYAFFWVAFTGTLVSGVFSTAFAIAGNKRNDDLNAHAEHYEEWMAIYPADDSVEMEASIYSKMVDAKHDADSYRNAAIGFGVTTGVFGLLATIGLIAGSVRNKGETETEIQDETLLEVSAAPGGLAVSF